MTWNNTWKTQPLCISNEHLKAEGVCILKEHAFAFLFSTNFSISGNFTQYGGSLLECLQPPQRELSFKSCSCSWSWQISKLFPHWVVFGSIFSHFRLPQSPIECHGWWFDKLCPIGQNLSLCFCKNPNPTWGPASSLVRLPTDSVALGETLGKHTKLSQNLFLWKMKSNYYILIQTLFFSTD